MNREKFDVQYCAHQHTENWEKTKVYCPRCGNQEIWFRCDCGDYYVGEQHICTGCKATFYLPGGISDVVGDQDEQRLKKLTSN